MSMIWIMKLKKTSYTPKKSFSHIRSERDKAEQKNMSALLKGSRGLNNLQVVNIPLERQILLGLSQLLRNPASRTTGLSASQVWHK